MTDRRVVAPAMGWLAALAFEAALILATVRSSRLGLALAALFGLGVLAVCGPVAVVAAVLPAAWLRTRVGPAAFDLTLSDVALVVGAGVALTRMSWASPTVRRVLGGCAVYLLAALIAVVADPNRRSILEWLHRVALAPGAVVVGAAVVVTGVLSRAMAVFVALSSVFGAAAIIEAATSGFEPAYPLGMHKNAAGFLLLIAVLICVVAPSSIAMAASLRRMAVLVCSTGLLATQNRGAAVAAVVCAAVWAVRQPRVPAVARALFVGAAAAVLTVVISAFSSPVESRSQFDSVASRQLTNEYALDLWRDDPLTGAGIRFFRDPSFFFEARIKERTTFGEPHNVVVSVLSETGLVGLAGFAAMVVTALRVLRPMRFELGRLAMVVLVARLVEAQFGIWWVAGSAVVPFILLGAAAAVADRDRADTASVAPGRPANSSPGVRS
jgi:O-antigen ligase